MKTKILSTLGGLALTLFLTAGGPAGTQTAKAQGLVEYALVKTLVAVVVIERVQLPYVERGTSFSTDSSGGLKAYVNCCPDYEEPGYDSCEVGRVCHCLISKSQSGGATQYSCIQTNETVNNGSPCDCPGSLYRGTVVSILTTTGNGLAATFESVNSYLE